jgi:hypothetical protein
MVPAAILVIIAMIGLVLLNALLLWDRKKLSEKIDQNELDRKGDFQHLDERLKKLEPQ